jgi:VWFA-related protein
MRSQSISVLSFVLITLFGQPSFSRQTAPQQRGQDEQTVRIGTTEVSLDVVVRDKKGKPVKDLTAADFEVYEDGIRQNIETFRVVLREIVTGASNERKGGVPAPAAVPLTRESMGVIALVFDRLSPEARSLARKAGIAYAEEGLRNGDFTGVFGIDQSLRTVQPYTDSAELIKQAVERATATSTSTYVSGNAKVRDLSERNVALDQQISTQQAAAAAAGAARDASGASAAGAAGGQAAAQQALNEMESRILENFEALERDQQGFATINSLLALITSMRNLPGRKSIVLFSEGLALPQSVQTKFPAVINAANRANVTIYTIDSAGLRIESGTAEAAREINSLASKRMQQTARGDERMSSGPYTKALERNEDLLRLDPRSGLGTLADETGGFLIHDTNDLGAGVRRIGDDMHAYYLLTYIPKNRDYNGQFRHISVKVSRGNLEAQTRKGYYAVEAVGQFPVLDYEIPALAAARSSHSAAAPSQSLRVAALDFSASNHRGLAVLLAELPMSTFSFSPAPDKKTYAADFSIIALVRNSANQVVQKVSQHYPLSGPIEKLEVAKKGDVLFYRETQLPAGRYSVEFIAYDARTEKPLTRNSELEVLPAEEGRLRLSSVVVLQRAERISPEEQKKDQPFHFGELLVYPNMGEPIVKAATKQLAFFFTAWTAKGASQPPRLSIEILRDSRSVGRTASQLPAADPQGRIKYASSLGVESFQPGAYELKVTVSDGQTSVSRSTHFAIE